MSESKKPVFQEFQRDGEGRLIRFARVDDYTFVPVEVVNEKTDDKPKGKKDTGEI